MAARQRAATAAKPRPRRGRVRLRAKIRIGLVGCGGMGRHHALNLLAIPEVEVAALCDVVKGRLQQFTRELFAPKGVTPARYTDCERMLAREQLDAVALVTPHAVHYPHARAALEAGLHVLVEKPMATDTDHARELVALARRKKRLLAVAFQAPVSAEFVYIANLIRRGDLGRLELITGRVAQDWQRFSARTWRQDCKQAGGGYLYDTGAHMLNAMLWLVREPVEQVYALADNAGSRVDVNASLSLRFANGCLGSVTCAGDGRGPVESSLVLHGSGGTVVTGIWGESLEHFDAEGEKVRYPYVPYATLTPQRNFVDAILGHDELRCPGEWGVRLCALMDAVYESADTGRPALPTPEDSR